MTAVPVPFTADDVDDDDGVEEIVVLNVYICRPILYQAYFWCLAQYIDWQARTQSSIHACTGAGVTCEPLFTGSCCACERSNDSTRHVSLVVIGFD